MREAQQILTDEMLALSRFDSAALLEVLERKQSWLSNLSSESLGADELLEFWRLNRQLLKAYRQLSPGANAYSLRGRK